MIISPKQQEIKRIIPNELTWHVSMNAPLELFFALNAIANPDQHIDCEAWASARFDRLSPKLQSEIRYMAEHYAQWVFATDVVEHLTGNMKPEECTVETAARLIRSMNRNDFAYIFLGLAAFGYEKDMLNRWYEKPDSLEIGDLGVQQQFFHLEDVVYFLKHTEEIKERLIYVMQHYWEESFSRDWEMIEHFERAMIEREKKKLTELGVLRYIEELHPDVTVDDQRICFHKDPDFFIDIPQIESVCINLSVFLGDSVGANVVGNRLFLAKGLSFQQAMASSSVPQRVLELCSVCSDETRMKMIRILWNGHATTQKLSETLHISPSTASQHLKLLKTARMVDSYKVNKFVYYYLKRDCFDLCMKQLIEYLEK